MKLKKLLPGLFIMLVAVFFIVSGTFAGKAQQTFLETRDEATVSTKEIKSEDQYIQVNIKIPVIQGMKNKKIQDKINTNFERDAVDFKNKLEKEARLGFEDARKNNYPFRVYQAYIDYKVTYMESSIISIPVTYYSYTGGAHGTTEVISRNIDLKTGKELALKDIFKEDTDYKNLIKQEVIKQIKLEPGIYFEDAIQTVEESKEDPSFYIEDGHIVVYYPLYSIAPYASGIREFRIPVNALPAILNA